MRNLIGNVYLLCFDPPLAHAKHYLGFTEHDDVEIRVEEHRKGIGARICAVAVDRGITLKLVRTWTKKTRSFERSLKKRGKSHLCPNCSEKEVVL